MAGAVSVVGGSSSKSCAVCNLNGGDLISSSVGGLGGQYEDSFEDVKTHDQTMNLSGYPRFKGHVLNGDQLWDLIDGIQANDVLHTFTYRIILYTIVLADYDQEKLEVCKDVISAKSGINRLAVTNHQLEGKLYLSKCKVSIDLAKS